MLVDGRSLLRTPPSRVIRHGIARTFQNVELFGTMTVLENVLVGAHAGSRFERERSVRARARRRSAASTSPSSPTGPPPGSRSAR